ncbi:MAG: hypothetical protein QXD98_01810 [Candidatus Diapherotrites archaeon]
MVNRYFVAFVLTFLVIGFGLVLTKFFDDSRINAILDSVEFSALDLQYTKQISDYENIFGLPENYCVIMTKSIETQSVAVRKAYLELQAVEKQNFLGNLDLLIKKYHVQNIELYLLLEKARKSCSDLPFPIVFLYNRNSYCADCISQGKILDSVVAKCNNVRVFAFPFDDNIPVVELIKASRGIVKAPSVVVGKITFDSLVSEQKILSSLPEGVCS